MIDEYSNSFPEYTPINEFEPLSENETFIENVIPPEMLNIEEAQEPEEPAQVADVAAKDKKTKALSALTGSLTAVIASVLVGITTLLNVAMTANFDKVDYIDGGIAYEITVEEMTEKETLTAYLYEDGSLIDTLSLADEDGDGKIIGNIPLDAEKIKEKLAESAKVEYRLDLKGVVGLDVERSFDSYVVKIEQVTSAFSDIEGYCNCGVDGYYYFKMNFTDDLGIFTDFDAYIVDSTGAVAKCALTDDLHAEQRIYVRSLRGASGTLVITYSSDGEEQKIEQRVNF